MRKINSQQVLLPKKVYIGDTAELRCSFNTNNATLKQLVAKGPANLSTEQFTAVVSANDLDIKQIRLEQTGVDFYQLTVTFVPWKTGNIELPGFQFDDEIIELNPVTIVSILEQSNTSALKDSAAPLLLPGTTYKLYGTLIAALVVIIVLIRVIIKRKNISFYFKNKKLLRKYRKNKRAAVKKLKAVLSESSDYAAAGEIQKIMRHYLEVRFDFPFTHAVTSELMNGFTKATGGLLGETKIEAFGEIVSAFIRTDFIRYSTGARFKADEKSALINNLIEKIEILEKIENA